MRAQRHARTLADVVISEQTSGGSAGVQGPLWGRRARDLTMLEPKAIVLYEAVLEELAVGDGTRLLDVGCGPGWHASPCPAPRS